MSDDLTVAPDCETNGEDGHLISNGFDPLYGPYIACGREGCDFKHFFLWQTEG